MPIALPILLTASPALLPNNSLDVLPNKLPASANASTLSQGGVLTSKLISSK